MVEFLVFNSAFGRHMHMVDRMVQKLALGATGAKRLHRRAAAVTGVYTEIVEREALLQA